MVESPCQSSALHRIRQESRSPQAGGRPRLHSEFVGYSVRLCLKKMEEPCTGGSRPVTKSGSSRGPFPSPHMGFTTAYNSSPRRSDTLFWSTRASTHTPYSHTNTYSENFYPKSLNSRQGSLHETKLSGCLLEKSLTQWAWNSRYSPCLSL